MKGNTPSFRAAAAANPRVAAAERGHFSCSIWLNVSILIWASRATEPALRRIQRVTHELTTRFPAGHSNVAFVLDGVGPPTPEARKILTHLYREGVADLKCLGVVLEGGGFWASSLRSSITSMQLEAGRRTALGQYTSIAEIAAWMAPRHAAQTGVEISVEELQAALEAAREHAHPAAIR